MLDREPSSALSVVMLGLSMVTCGEDPALGGAGKLDDDETSVPADLPDCDGCGFVGFTEVAAQSGLTYVAGAFNMPPDCMIDTIDPAFEGHFCAIEWSSGGAAVVDFDDDGWLDLYVSTLYGPDLLYRNLGDGTFADVADEVGLGAPRNSAGIAWGDLDNDGDQDLYLSSVADPRNYLFVNQGGHFEERAQERGVDLDTGHPHTGTSVALGDFDNDGFLDLYSGDWHTDVLGDYASNARLFRNLGESAPAHFEDVTDAAGVNMDEVHLQSPTPTVGTFVLSAGFADLDGDDWTDLILPADFFTSRLFWNDHDGSFTDGTEAALVGTEENGMGSSIADYDRDGDLDWFVTSVWGPYSTGNRLFRNEGGRVFLDVTDAAGVRIGDWGWGAVWHDQDNDADLDLVHTNGWNGTLYLPDPMVAWTNDGTGSLSPSAKELGFTDKRQGRGLVSFDYDNDGDVDIFVVNMGDTPLLYRNDSETDNAWLRVRVAGTQSNRDGIGARVVVRRDGVEQMAEVGTTSLYLGHSERIVHFGLGRGDDSVDELRVRWPSSGREIVLQEVAANQILSVTEPAN